MMNKSQNWVTMAAIALLSAACGGGSSGSSVAGIDRLGVVNGPISGFGSVIVNGVAYDTSAAEFIVDENPGAQQADLRVGDVVLITVDPQQSPTRALQVISQAALEGPVQVIDLATNELTVAGLTVRITADTIIDDSVGGGELVGISVGDFLEVHGFVDAAGGLRATRIDTGNGDVEVSGIISNLDVVAQTFNLGALLVDYGAVPAEIEGFAGGELVNGAEVEAEGALNGAGVLLADNVEADDLEAIGIDFDDFDQIEVELEGLITRFVSATDFDVAGFPVRTNGGTEFENGAPADLGLDVRVEVEGQVDQNGVLVADEVEFEEAIDLVVSGQVDADPVGGVITVLGIDFAVTPTTALEDQSDADLESLTLAQINTGDYVTVVSSESDGTFFASVIERDDLPDGPGDDTEITGRIEQIAQPTFTIAGVTIETSVGTEFEDSNGNPLSPQAFFNALVLGAVVEAEGFESGATVLQAEEVEFDDLDD